MRRIVMGSDATGGTKMLADADVEPIIVNAQPGVSVTRMWELDATPGLPVEAVQDSPAGTVFPATGGLRFGYISISPGITYEMPPGLTPEAMEAAAAEAEAKLPGMGEAFDRSRPGMHTTHTVDFIVVVSGEGRMQTDSGEQVRLGPGDCVIQNGTPHAWFNDGDEPFVFGYALAGAR